MPASIEAILDALPYLLQGSLVTIGVVLGAMGLGLAIGVTLALGQVYGPRVLQVPIGLYIWFFRGVPLLVLFSLMGLNLSAFAVAAIVLGLISAAYQSQIFRGAILSLPEGQLKAARALGMSDTRAIVSVILPQALRLSIPGWSNEYSIVLKDSAVAYALGVAEVMARAHFTAGLIFLVLTFLGTRGLRTLEERVRIPGYSR